MGLYYDFIAIIDTRISHSSLTNWNERSKAKGSLHSIVCGTVSYMIGTRYFWISDQSIMSRQKGVFRVNCIDCLDRTNVVQVRYRRHFTHINSYQRNGTVSFCSTRYEQAAPCGG